MMRYILFLMLFVILANNSAVAIDTKSTEPLNNQPPTGQVSNTPPTGKVDNTNPITSGNVLQGTVDNDKDIAAAGSLDWLGTCWMCSIFKILNDARISFSPPACSFVSKNVLTIIPISIGIFMMISAAMLLLPFGPQQKASVVLGTLFNRSLLMIVITVVVYDCKTFNNYISDPIFNTGIGASKMIMEAAVKEHTAFGLKTDCEDPLAKGKGTEASFYCMLEVASKTIGLPISLGMQILRPIDNTPWQTALEKTTGGGTGSYLILQWLMALVLVFLGMLVVLFYFMINVDFIIYVTIFEVLSSFYVLLFLHPITRGFALSSLKGLITSGVSLFLASVVLTGQFAVINYIVDIQPELKTADDIKSYKVDKGEKDSARGFGDPIFVMLVAGQLIINAAMKSIPEEAKKIVGAASNLGIPQIGADFASKTQETLQKATSGAIDAIALGGYAAKLERENYKLMNKHVWKKLGKTKFGKGVYAAASPVMASIFAAREAAAGKNFNRENPQSTPQTTQPNDPTPRSET